MVDWRFYERFVARLMAEHASDEITIIPNAKIIGAISGVQRQIDVLIDAKWEEDISRRIIVDAKRYKRKVDVKDVETFEGMMRDCQAQHGVLVCPNGFTKAAKKRAQDAITIKLLPLEEAEAFDLRSWDPCVGSCLYEANHDKHGLVLYDSPYGLAIGNSPLSIMAVGKCDRCHEFHIWCWDCGEKFALKDEDEHKCSCDGRFWLTAIEEDGKNPEGIVQKSVLLLLILRIGPTVIPVDRRRLW